MKPCILVAIDRTGWCYAETVRQMERHLGEFTFDPRTFSEIEPGRYAAAICLWWGHAEQVRKVANPKRLILGVYDDFAWKGAPERVAHFARALAVSDAVVAGNDSIAEEVGRLTSLPIAVIEDGVDLERFRPLPLPAEFTVGWCGNADFPGRDLKGTELLALACAKAGVPLQLLDAANGNAVSPKDMPDWYRSITVQVCASRAESTPRPLLEAMACGRSVLSTPVGIAKKLVDDGGGYLVERSISSIARALEFMKSMPAEKLLSLGAQARRTAEQHGWAEKLSGWRKVLG